MISTVRLRETENALVGMAVPSRPRVVAAIEHADKGLPSPEPPSPADGSESHPYHALPCQ